MLLLVLREILKREFTAMTGVFWVLIQILTLSLFSFIFLLIYLEATEGESRNVRERERESTNIQPLIYSSDAHKDQDSVLPEARHQAPCGRQEQLFEGFPGSALAVIWNQVTQASQLAT